MQVDYAKLRELERRFAHLNRCEVGESIFYRTKRGRELFRLEGNGSRLRLPVSYEILQSLFGEVPFHVEPFGDSCVIPLDTLHDEVLLWTLLEALGEQSVDTTDELRRQDPVDVIERSIEEIEATSPPPKRRKAQTAESEIAGSTRQLPLHFIVRVAVAGFVLLFAAFLTLSFLLGAKPTPDDPRAPVEQLLRR